MNNWKYRTLAAFFALGWALTIVVLLRVMEVRWMVESVGHAMDTAVEAVDIDPLTVERLGDGVSTGMEKASEGVSNGITNIRNALNKDE